MKVVFMSENPLSTEDAKKATVDETLSARVQNLARMVSHYNLYSERTPFSSIFSYFLFDE